MVGTYLAKIKGHILAEKGEKKTPCVSLTFDVIANAMTQEAAPGVVYADLWLTEAAFPHTMKTLSEAIGWTGDDLSDFNGTGNFIGVDVWVVCEEQTYEGKTQTKVKFVNKVGGIARSSMDAEKTKDLAEKLKGKVLAYRQKKPVDDGLKF